MAWYEKDKFVFFKWGYEKDETIFHGLNKRLKIL